MTPFYYFAIIIFSLTTNIILKKWFTYPKSKLEDLERLEQLKLIEAGCIFDTFKIDGDSLSIDTPEQLEEARSYSKKLRKNV